MRNARCDFVSLSNTQWFPLWLGYLGAFLEKKNHEVRLIDAPAYGLDHQETQRLALEFRPDFLVVYTGRLSEDNDVSFADKLSSTLEVPAVFVGPYTSIDPEKTLGKARCVKLAVKGEFEHPVADVIDGKDPHDIPNLVYRDGDTVLANPARPLLGRQELDELPFATDFFYRHLNLKHYRTPSEHHPFLDLMTGRGCAWGRCTYCLWVHSFVKGAVYNTRSVESVVEEFRFVKNRIPAIRSLMIQDDTVTEERAEEISLGLLKAGVKSVWSCYLRGNVSFETLQLMARAGCRNVHVGYESADQVILAKIRKGLTVERMTRFTEEAKRAGLHIHGDFAIGFPGETEESIRKTIDWAWKLRPDTAQFQLMIPFPGTPFYEELASQGYLEGGSPDYPHLSRQEMEAWAKKAYRRFYISLPFLKQVLAHPIDMFLSKLDTYWNAVPSVFWKRYRR